MSSPNFLFEVNDLVMKKKILSVREHYDFEEVNGAKLGEADGAIIQVPPKFVVVDNHGQELMHLEGKMLSFRSQFTIYDNQGVELGTIQKKIVKLVGEEYWVEKNGVEFMRIYGDFTEHDYQMEVNGVSSCFRSQEMGFTARPNRNLNNGKVDHRVVIGAVVVIEHIEVTERSRIVI